MSKNDKDIYLICKKLGCCDNCTLRLLHIRKPHAYENAATFCEQYKSSLGPSEVLKEYGLAEEYTQPEIPATVTSDIISSTETLNTKSEINDKISNSETHKVDMILETEISTVINEAIPSSKNKQDPSPETDNKNRVLESNMAKKASTETLVSNLGLKVNHTIPVTEVNETSEINGTKSALESLDTDNTEPPAKRHKGEVCVSCLGILQETNWQSVMNMVKNMLEQKKYDSHSFCCALFMPLALLLREKAIGLLIAESVQNYTPSKIVPLKEAWKWSFASKLSSFINKELDSGASSPLRITFTMEYPDEDQELQTVYNLAPALFKNRSKQRRYNSMFSRGSVEGAVQQVDLNAIRAQEGWSVGVKAASSSVKCVSVTGEREPLYLGGRYVKLSRELPQTPWMVNGVKMMETSVQEIIFQPIAEAYGISLEESNNRLKLVSAGREDVDVRCLGDGRPFAVEIMDPLRELTEKELKEVCEKVSSTGKVEVKTLVYVTREDLALLKSGEETKSKTYEALCIKLAHTEEDIKMGLGEGPVAVTSGDIANINSYRNTVAESEARVVVQQRTPLRVLHRRPLHARTRHIYRLAAELVHGPLFVLKVSTQAGTYVKEWVHGELRRTRPSLQAALRAPADILALDVTAVHLSWPPSTCAAHVT